jgi:ketosteroid isomerase-like protein
MTEQPTMPDLEEVALRSLAAFVRHDLDGVLAVYRPDAVWDMSSMGMGVFEGREAIRGFLEDWLGAWKDYQQVMEEFRDVGNAVTLGVFLQRGRAPRSSAFVALRYAQVGTWTDGLVERVTIYTDIDEARAAAERLAEQRG